MLNYLTFYAKNDKQILQHFKNNLLHLQFIQQKYCNFFKMNNLKFFLKIVFKIELFFKSS